MLVVFKGGKVHLAGSFCFEAPLNPYVHCFLTILYPLLSVLGLLDIVMLLLGMVICVAGLTSLIKLRAVKLFVTIGPKLASGFSHRVSLN